MRKKLSTLVLLLLVAAGSVHALDYDFSAVTSSGHRLYYSRSGSNTCCVTYPNYSFSDYWYNVTRPTGSLVIDSTVNYWGTTYIVTDIDYRAFDCCTGLTSVTIPNSVTSIGERAFDCCTGLTSVTIPSSVTSIGKQAFYFCTGLTSITIPNSVTNIGSSAFWECTGLTSVTIPNSVTTIGSYAFYECTSLSSVIYNATNCTTARLAFGCCDRLASVTIGNNVQTIPASIFCGCSITSIIIPESVTSIGGGAFRDCTNLASVIYNSTNCTRAGDDSYPYPVFKDCSNLVSVTIGNNVQIIPDSLFRDCSSLSVLYLDADSNSISSIGAYAFDGCSNMAGHIVVPHLQSLGDNAFRNCGMLSSVELGNGLSSVGENTFAGCNHLTNVTLGRGVTTIAGNAFTECTEIRLLTSRALNPPVIYRETFADVDDDISVRVPCDAVAAYQNAPFWSHFENIEGKYDYFFSATSSDITRGSVTIVQAPVCDNIQAHIQANPYHGYHFDCWSDGNHDNPRYMIVTQDTIITAIFESDNDTIGIEDVDQEAQGPKVYADGGRIVVTGAEGEDVSMYDMMGRRIATRQEYNGPVVIEVPAAGVYLVRVGEYPARRVVVIR